MSQKNIIDDNHSNNRLHQLSTLQFEMCLHLRLTAARGRHLPLHGAGSPCSLLALVRWCTQRLGAERQVGLIPDLRNLLGEGLRGYTN